jgi:cytochrome c peroxidase
MGITGFDTPGCLAGVAETHTALESIDSILFYLGKTPPAWTENLKAAKTLVSGKGFDEFDRAGFLRGPWQKLFASLGQIRQSEGTVLEKSAINKGAVSLFGNGFLNLDFFAPDTMISKPELAALGKKLFFDPRLSMHEKFSCATCHQPEKYYTDQLPLSDNIHGTPLSRNTPGLINTAFQTNYFWDMRVLNLEMQARSVIENANEMHGSLDKVAEKLNNDEPLKNAFQSVYGGEINKAISPERITAALAAFQRTLSDFESPFDDYMNGNDTVVTMDAVAGFNLFMGKAKCATCHFPPTFAGLVPPFFDKMESEVIGTPATAANNKKDADPGRYAIHPVPAWENSFKTPTVRNSEFTFPYMHNGVYKTLEQVVDFYNAGGGAGMGIDYPNQTLPTDSLHLNDTEKKQLVVFMKSLSGKTPY